MKKDKHSSKRKIDYFNSVVKKELYNKLKIVGEITHITIHWEGDRVGLTKEDLKQISLLLNPIRDEIKEFKKDTNRRFEQIENRLDKMDQRFEQIDEEINNIKEDIKKP